LHLSQRHPDAFQANGREEKRKNKLCHYYIKDSLDLGMMSLVPEEV